MTTFTTKNQSRKRYYRAIWAVLIIIILVTFIVLSRRDRNVSNNSNSQHDRGNKNGASSANKRLNGFYSDDLVEYEPLIQLQGLQIKGQVRTVSNGKMVASFLGIPYAEPPIDDNRFSAPQIKQFKNKNVSVLEASYQPIKCYQSTFVLSITEVRSLGEESKEDCLYLNIWVPFKEDCNDCNKTMKTEKPVMIFIHSGLFQFGGIGSPDLDPSKLVAEKDIIAITIQYRLGVFGFGSSEKESNGKNFQSFGLQDQAKALEWVTKNIRAFGGSPNQITLAGHGAGALSIGFHLMHHRTKKMFQRAILQGIQNIWNIGIYGINSKSIRYLMEDSNCDDESISDRDLKGCIRNTRIQPIILLEGQSYLIDIFPFPFVPEFNPLTKEISDKIQEMTTEARFNESLLNTLFSQWNIFSTDHEIMIGLNSDDDYQFEKFNKVTTKIRFGDQEEGEEEEEEEDEDEGYREMDNENEDNENKSINDDNETTKNEEEETLDLDEEISNDKKDNENENETTTTMKTTINDLIQRRRRQTNEASKLDKDEMIKLCRLVKMYQLQKKRVNVSSQVILYRIDPKVLVNPLEEVSFAFGVKSNWLEGLDTDTMNLWGSFVANGMAGLRASKEILSKYDSKLFSENGPINMINVGQMKENESHSQIDITMFDLNKLCSIQS